MIYSSTDIHMSKILIKGRFNIFTPRNALFGAFNIQYALK